MFGIDEIFEKLLNEARSIEDIQKLLINRYVRNGDVPQEAFMDIFNADPTKKKAYARWMLDKYGNESKLIDMIVSNGIASSMFKYFQERAHGESPINLVDIPNNVASTVYGIVHARFAPELNAIIYINTESQEIIDYIKTLYNYKPIDEPNQLTESFRNMMKRLNKVAF